MPICPMLSLDADGGVPFCKQSFLHCPLFARYREHVFGDNLIRSPFVGFGSLLLLSPDIYICVCVCVCVCV